MHQLGAVFRFCTAEEICQQLSDVFRLICHAELARSSVLKLARSLAQDLNLNPDLNVKMGPIKTFERITQKALGRKHGRVDHVTDICRERLLIESIKDVMEIRRFIRNPDFHAEWQEKGIKILEVEDYFATPNERGLRAMNMLLYVDLGKGRYHICELQVIHKDMEDTYNTTHVYYEIIRDLQELEKAQKRPLSAVEKDTIMHLTHETRRLHDEDAARLQLGYLETPKSAIIKLAA